MFSKKFRDANTALNENLKKVVDSAPIKKDFVCGKCLKVKKIELYSHTIHINGAKRKVCSHCNERILEAANKRVINE